MNRNYLSLAAVALLALGFALTAQGYESDALQAQGRAAVLERQLDEATAQHALMAAQLADKLPLDAEYIGEFLTTSYCKNCPECGTTDTCYSGEPFVADVSCAPAKSMLDKYPLGTWLYIDGIGIRRVSDIGGGVAENQIDVAVSGTHEDALNWGGYGMHKVYVLKGE